MAKGFKHGAGGISLNFKVICNPQPSTAKENTIWVDTDKINNYYFSAEQPENMTEYDVWFPVGAYSIVALPVTKKNPITIYPLSVKQLISGELVDMTAEIYQGGNWVELINKLWIIKDGHLQTKVVSGLKIGSYDTGQGSMSQGNTYIQLSTPVGSYTRRTSNETIPTSKFSKLCLEYESSNSSGSGGNGEKFALDSDTCQISGGNVSRNIQILDISAIDYDCTFSLIARAWYNGGTTTNIYYNLWLE